MTRSPKASWLALAAGLLATAAVFPLLSWTARTPVGDLLCGALVLFALAVALMPWMPCFCGTFGTPDLFAAMLAASLALAATPAVCERLYGVTLTPGAALRTLDRDLAGLDAGVPLPRRSAFRGPQRVTAGPHGGAALLERLSPSACDAVLAHAYDEAAPYTVAAVNGAASGGACAPGPNAVSLRPRAGGPR